jgi:hypothetical protein
VTFLSFADLKRIGIPYSPSSLRRLEAVNQFPRRRLLGLRKVAWLKTEVDAWSAARSGRLANMTQHKIPYLHGATNGTSVSLTAAGHGEMPDNPSKLSPERQASYERQASRLEQDLKRVGLEIPASGKLSITAVDKALVGMPTRQRMEFKGKLRQFGVIPV